MNKIKLLLATLSLSTMALAQAFEGTIEFKMETAADTTTNIYYVKGNNVRLDQIGRKSGKVEGCFLFDVAANEMKSLSPIRKVWTEHRSETVPTIKGTCVTTKGANTKMIQGQKCSEYIVKNTEENTQVTYWMISGKYDFFAAMVKLWNRKDKQSIYFNQIKDLPKGSMPMMSEEKLISTGAVVTKLEVTKLTKSTLDASKFDVPAEYKKFEQK